MHKSWTLGIVPLLAGALILVTGCSSDSTGPTQSGAGIHVSIAPAPLTRVVVGTTQVFTATLTNDAKNAGVTWTVSGAGCAGAACGSVSVDSGVSLTTAYYAAPGTVPTPAAVTLTATSITDPTRSASAVFSITLPVRVDITPIGLGGVDVGTTRQFTATVGDDPDNLGVTWSASGSGCSGVTCGTFSAAKTGSGVAVTYTAPASAPSPDLITIRATSVSDSIMYASATVIVTAPGVVTVVVSPATAYICTYGTAQNRCPVITHRLFTAYVFNDPGNAGVTWSSQGQGSFSAMSSASGVAVTYNPRVLSTGSVVLTATSVSDPSKSATATVSLYHH